MFDRSATRLLVALRQSGLLPVSANIGSSRIGGPSEQCGYEIAFHKAMATFNHQVVFDVQLRMVRGYVVSRTLSHWYPKMMSQCRSRSILSIDPFPFPICYRPGTSHPFPAQPCHFASSSCGMLQPATLIIA